MEVEGYLSLRSVTCMESLVKPFGAFLEYTVLPILDRSREFIELCEKHGLKVKSMLKVGVLLFFIDKVFSIILTVTITLIVCQTALSISRLTIQ